MHIHLTLYSLLRSNPLLRFNVLDEPGEVLKADYHYAQVVHRFFLHRVHHYSVNTLADDSCYMLERPLVVSR